jgi:hypothetical protein
MTEVKDISKGKKRRGKRGRKILTMQERSLLINYMEPLCPMCCTVNELNINIVKIKEFCIELMPSLTYSIWAGGLTATGRKFHEKRLWSFEAFSLGENIIWTRANLQTKELEGFGLPYKLLTRKHIVIILKYLRQSNQIL